MGLLFSIIPATGFAQATHVRDQDRSQLSRSDLLELLSRFEETARSSAYSEEFRARARYEATLARTRLEEGDFQVGDQIALTVEGEEQLSNTFVVSPRRTLVLPQIGEIPLSGVMRSELEAHLSTHLGRFIREPVVQARALIRILISGAVSTPGFYVVPAEALITEAIMLAGGPTPEGKLTAIRIQRNNQKIWDGDPLQQAIVEGRTLDQISIRAGDQIVVPTQIDARNRAQFAMQLVSGVSALILSIVAISQVF